MIGAQSVSVVYLSLCSLPQAAQAPRKTWSAAAGATSDRTGAREHRRAGEEGRAQKGWRLARSTTCGGGGGGGVVAQTVDAALTQRTDVALRAADGEGAHARIIQR
jgi:hypothetical protein